MPHSPPAAVPSVVGCACHSLRLTNRDKLPPLGHRITQAPSLSSGRLPHSLTPPRQDLPLACHSLRLTSRGMLPPVGPSVKPAASRADAAPPPSVNEDEAGSNLK